MDKAATKAYNAEYYKTHREEIKSRVKAYQESNSAKIKSYREANTGKIKSYKRAHYIANKETENARSKAYRKTHAEQVRAYNKKYREENIDCTKERIYNNTKYSKNSVEIICIKCGKPGKVYNRTSKRFCSHECALAWHSGPNSPRWLGGISFEPYCPKFNKDLKRRIRAFFEYSCITCGKSTEENRRALGCHHVEYSKTACCDGEPVHFAALCNRCHARTNNDRARWEAMLHRIIDEIYGGRSYYTKEEWEALRSDRSKHRIFHMQLEKIAIDLYKKGLVKFDTSSLEYRLEED